MDVAAVLTWASDNLPLAAAIVTAGISAAISLLALFANPFLTAGIERLKGDVGEKIEKLRGETQRQIELQRAQLLDENSERGAKRDYEYEARKRLYEHIEPLMFQLHEAAEAALVRVESLVRTGLDGHLGPTGWTSHDGYYLRSTGYRLLLPAALLRLLQRKMTFVDMTLDQRYRRVYRLLRNYAALFSDDYGVAALEPSLLYKPAETGVTDPLHRKQGVFMGRLESAMDSMLVKEGDHYRSMTFSEFDAALENRTEAAGQLKEFMGLFAAMDPDEHQILARIVHIAGCYAYLIATFTEGSEADPMKLAGDFLISERFRALAWQPSRPLDVAPYATYFAKKLQPL